MENRDKLLERARKLMKVTSENGASESEAMFAAEKLGQLLQENNLSMTEIDVKEEARHCVTEEWTDDTSKRSAPMSILHGAVCAFTGCKGWTTQRTVEVPSNFGVRRELRMFYCFFGLGADAAIATYLMTVVSRAMIADRKRYMRQYGGGRSAGHSFGLGFAGRIRTRLRDLKAAREYEQPKTGTALVVLKNQLVDDAYKVKAKELNMRTGRGLSTHSRDFNAMTAGTNSANSVGLNQAIASGAHNRKAIA